MTAVSAAIGIASIGGALLSSSAQNRASDRAVESQERATEMSIEEQRRQFDKLQEVLQPFVQAGTGAIGAQGDLIGLGGEEAQQAAIDQLEGGAEFQSLVQQGEEGILQNASATGGLRGGNTQRKLSEFRPQILSSLINQQFGRLSNLSSLGQASAAGVGAGAIRTGENISRNLINQGEAQGFGALSRGRTQANLFGDIGSVLGTAIGSFGGSGSSGGVTSQLGSSFDKYRSGVF